MIRPPLPPLVGSRLRSAKAALLVASIGSLAGCRPADGPLPVTIATAWPSNARTYLAETYRRDSPKSAPIEWVVLDLGAAPDPALDRRGGVDIVLGGTIEWHERLNRSGKTAAIDPTSIAAWELAIRPDFAPIEHSGGLADPRTDPASLARAKTLIDDAGWSSGYETLVRDASRTRSSSTHPLEPPRPAWTGRLVERVSLGRGGRNTLEARRFLKFFERQHLIVPTNPTTIIQGRADLLLADLLGAALVDSHEDLREASAALIRFGHPPKAEAAIGEPPPWPPASIARLKAEPNGEAMVETLLSQIATDPGSRAWLAGSWSRPKRPIDPALLAEVAEALDGQLIREPRFRAWLRGEWTAWTRQLYRRVARVAGGYIPS